MLILDINLTKLQTQNIMPILTVSEIHFLVESKGIGRLVITFFGAISRTKFSTRQRKISTTCKRGFETRRIFYAKARPENSNGK
jgi:hypothetical protein